MTLAGSPGRSCARIGTPGASTCRPSCRSGTASCGTGSRRAEVVRGPVAPAPPSPTSGGLRRRLGGSVALGVVAQLDEDAPQLLFLLALGQRAVVVERLLGRRHRQLEVDHARTGGR